MEEGDKTLSDGTVVYFIGPPLSQGPLPAFIYFSISGYESLHLEPFCHPAQTAASKSIRVFSFDLPYHVNRGDHKKVMETWRQELENGHNFIAEYIQRISSHIEELTKLDIIKESYIALGGLSRGGFVASHLAAILPTCKALVGFAPITKITSSPSFHSMQNDPLAESLNLNTIKESFIKVPLRYYIGNRDILVSTPDCFAFVQAVTEAAYEKGIRSPKVELMISPSIGYKGHGTPTAIFEQGAKWIQEHLEEPFL